MLRREHDEFAAGNGVDDLNRPNVRAPDRDCWRRREVIGRSDSRPILRSDQRGKVGRRVGLERGELSGCHGLCVIVNRPDPPGSTVIVFGAAVAGTSMLVPSPSANPTAGLICPFSVALT